MRSVGARGSLVIGCVLLCCLEKVSSKVSKWNENVAHFNQGIMLTRSKTVPVPSLFRAHTG